MAAFRHFIYTDPTQNSTTLAQTPAARQTDMDAKLAAFVATLAPGSTLVGYNNDYSSMTNKREHFYVFYEP